MGVSSSTAYICMEVTCVDLRSYQQGRSKWRVQESDMTVDVSWLVKSIDKQRKSAGSRDSEYLFHLGCINSSSILDS